MSEKSRDNRFRSFLSKFFVSFVVLALILPVSPRGPLTALAQEGTLSEVINRINAIQISDSPTKEEEQTAIAQMRDALSDPLLGVTFANAFDGFTDYYKEDTYSRMVYLVKYKPFVDLADVQAGLDYCIQQTMNLRTGDEEMPKYHQTATIPDTTRAGDDITDQILRLIEGNEKNPLVMVTAKKVLPMGGSGSTVEYLQVDQDGRVKLVKANTSGHPVQERVSVWFTVDDTSTGQSVEVTIQPVSQDGTISTAIDRINAIKISDNPTEEETKTLIAQMREAISDPILGLNFGQAFPGFSEEHKQETYYFMIYRVKEKPLADLAAVQKALDESIQYAINLQIGEEEARKYYQIATLPNTVKAGEDVTDQIIRLLEGQVKNPVVQLKLRRIEPTSPNQPVEYLQVDPSGRVILLKPNSTSGPVQERVSVWFTVDGIVSPLRVYVTIQPNGTTEAQTDSQIVQEEVNKYDRVGSISATTRAGADVTDQIIRLNDGMSKNPNVQVQIFQLEGMGGGNKPAQYLRADASGRIYLTQPNTTNTDLYEHVKIMLTSGTASQIIRIDVNILPSVQDGGLSDREILAAESEKYYKSAWIGNTSKVGDDVTDRIIRLIEGTQKNPVVAIAIDKVEGKGGGNKPAQYLQLDQSGRIKLIQENLTSANVYEHVQVSFKIGTSVSSTRIDVNIQSEAGNDGSYDVQVARAESDKYLGNVIIPSTTKVGDDVTNQIIRMMAGPEKNPAVTVNLHKIEGMGGKNNPAEYLQADGSGRITLSKENSANFTVYENVQIMFTFGTATSIKYVDVLFHPKTGTGQNSMLDIAIAESDKYYKDVSIANTSIVGEDVTDQVIRMIEGKEKNPHVTYKVRQIEGMGGGNKPSQYLQLDESGRIKLVQQNTTTNWTLTEYIQITFTTGTANSTTRINVSIPPQ